ncbi:MAG: glycosyl hydrolase 115 family protein, partial [Opitutales bacterium]|nr:glycosyl hydrolase 115 family protein [Opitutales bacterium]
MLSLIRSITPFFLLIPVSLFAQNTNWVHTKATESAFALVSGEKAATLVFEDSEHSVIEIAVKDLAKDVERVTDQRPRVQSSTEGIEGAVVLVGTVGQSAWIDALVEAEKIDLSKVEDQWETFLLQTVEAPLPGVDKGFVVIGSDRRGTAYGVYELSKAIGVSPWYWWADVTPGKAEALYLAGDTQIHGPPSVKYRGFFINDEDWKLHPWAMRTYDPELGDIGPKTYKRVFELMLRLKANTLWPAMHEVTKAFNIYPENKYLAERYAIVMGSSHAEPMLRNNVTEWTEPHADYNYVTNREGVREYWRQRVEENADFENIYTIGMRGIHDSGMVGADSDEQRIELLEQIFADQRAMIERYVDAPLEEVPQMFNPYKEVLDLYHGGLNVPDDVTIVWPNDNHGYIRYLPDETERARAGGSGIYYHISYLGAPFAYLWLYTTPPSLVWYEMNKAYDYGARDLWMLNVGDMKNSEIGTDLFLQMAWDIDRWNLDTLPDFLSQWAAREFGTEHADAIAGVMSDYFKWNHKRRPEHLQWYLPHGRFAQSPLSNDETRERLLAFEQMSEDAKELWEAVPEELQDAFFQLVYYPVRGSALANQRYFGIEQYHRFFNSNPPRARQFGALARAAEDELNAITAYYNSDLADGKWRH